MFELDPLEIISANKKDTLVASIMRSLKKNPIHWKKLEDEVKT